MHRQFVLLVLLCSVVLIPTGTHSGLFNTYQQQDRTEPVTSSVFRQNGTRQIESRPGRQSTFSPPHDAFIVEDQPYTTIANRSFVNQSLVLINSPGSIITNTTFQQLHGRTSQVAISLINSSSSVIEDTVISDLYSTEDETTGIEIEHSDNVTITNTVISQLMSSNNTIDQVSAISSAIRLHNTTGSTISGTSVSTITARLPFAIYIDQSYETRVTTTSIANIVAAGNDTESGGIVVERSDGIEITGNQIMGVISTAASRSTSFGITVHNSSTLEIVENVIHTIRSSSTDQNVFGIHATESERLKLMGNQIDKLEGWTSQVNVGYTTGIYFAYVTHSDMLHNTVTKIVNTGRAAYGVFIDRSVQITADHNTIEQVYSRSNQTTLASALTARDSPYFTGTQNRVKSINTTITTGGTDETISSLGIILDRSDNSTLTSNIVSNIQAQAVLAAGDAIGIFGHGSDHTELSHNSISDISTRDQDNGIATGMSLSSMIDITSQNTTITNLNSPGRSFGWFQSIVANGRLSAIQITDIQGKIAAYGQYIVLSSYIVVSNSRIVNLVTSGKSIAYQVSLSDAVSLHSTLLSDPALVDLSTGFYFTGGVNHTVSNNTVLNKSYWIKLQSDDIGIRCAGNTVDDMPVDTCENLPGEPHRTIAPTSSQSTTSQSDVTTDTETEDMELVLLPGMLLALYAGRRRRI